MARFGRRRTAQGFPSGRIDVFPEPIIARRDPLTNDIGEVGQIWINTTTDDVWFLTSVSGTATWVTSAGGSPTFDNITVTTAVTFSNFSEGALVSSSAGVISSIDGTDGQLLIGSSAAGTAPAWASITSGDGSVVIGAGSNTLDLTVSGATASTFPTDAGTATPALGATTIEGGTNCNTAGAGDTVTINVDNAPTFSGLISGSAGLSITAGTTTIVSDTDAANAIYLHANGGLNETIRLHSDQGNTADSINLLSDVGGITLQAVGLASDDAINLEADAGGIELDAAMQLNIASSEAAADAVRINAPNGGIDIDAGANGIAIDSTGAYSIDGAGASNVSVSGAGVDLTLQSTAGRVVVDGGEATADAVRLNAGSGGIDVDAADQININSSLAAVANSIRIVSSAADGGIDIDSGTGGMTIDSTGVLSLDSQGASNYTVTGAFDLTLDSTAGSVIIDGGEAVADAIRLNTSDVAGGIDIDSGTGGFIVDSTGAISLDSAAASNFTATGAFDVTISSTAGSVIIDGGEAVADAIQINTSDAAGGIDIDAGTGGITIDSTDAVSIDAAAASNMSVSGAGIDLTLASAAGRVIVNGEEAVANAVTLLSAAGGIDADSALQMNLDSSQAAADAIRLNASDAAGGLDIDSGTGGFIVDTTGAISLDSAAASNFTATGAFDLTLSSTAGSVIVDGGEAVADAVKINSSNVAGGIDIDAGTAGLTIDSTDLISIDAAAASNLTTSAGDMTVEATAGSVNINSGENSAQAIYLHANGGTTETIDIHADQGTADTSVNIHSDAGGITLNSGTGAVLMTPQTNSVAGTSLTLNSRVGVATFTGQTTASTATEDFTITNSALSAGAGVFVTVSNKGTNDADMTLEGVITETAGTLTVHTKNNGPATLNGDVIISFWIIN